MSTIKKVNVKGQEYELAGAGGGSSQIVEITYSEVKALVDSSSLIPGAKYRITDYVTEFKSWESAKHQFDIVVTAFSENKLFEKAYAMQHEGDDYFNNCKLQDWQIWYSINNDSSLMYEAKADGKGVIFRMIDEFNNDVCFDFKNALRSLSQSDFPFLPSGTLKFYAFSWYPVITSSLKQSEIKDASIEQYTNNKIKVLNNTIKKDPRGNDVPEVVLGINKVMLTPSIIANNLIVTRTSNSKVTILCSHNLSTGIQNNIIGKDLCEIQSPVINFLENIFKGKLSVNGGTKNITFQNCSITNATLTISGETSFDDVKVQGTIDLTFTGKMNNITIYSKSGQISLPESEYTNKIIVANSTNSNTIDLMTL